MNNKFKYLIAFVMIATLFTSTLAYGMTYATNLPRGNAGCSDSSDGRHHMEGRSTCKAINVNTGEEFWGQGGQCRYCHLLMVTENNLFLNPYRGMGKYATRDAWSEQGGPFTIEVTSFGYNSSHTNTFGKMFVWGG